MVPGMHLGVLLCPNPPYFKKICVIPDFPGKLQQGLPCYPDLVPIYPVFYCTWSLGGGGGMAEGLTIIKLAPSNWPGTYLELKCCWVRNIAAAPDPTNQSRAQQIVPRNEQAKDAR